MYKPGGRQFSRGGPRQGQRRFRGQYVRSRMSPNSHDHPDDDMYGQQPSSLNSQHQLHSNQHHQNHHPQTRDHHQPPSHNHQQQQQQQQQPPSRIMNRNPNQQHPYEDIKDLCLKLVSKLEQVESRIEEIVASLEQLSVSQQQVSSNQLPSVVTSAANIIDKRKKTKLLRRRNKLEREQQNGVNGDSLPDGERNLDRKRKNQRQEKPLPIRPNDDSTTQAADPSSEDKIEGENGERVKRVIRRRKPNYNRRGYNRRDRIDSSERNSNDTSPQNEVDDDDYRRPQKSKNHGKNHYPELTDAELDALVQAMTRDFFASEMVAVDKTIVERSPQVAKAFATAIIEHAICDVTSPNKLSEIAANLSQAVVGIEGGRKFERALYAALTDVSKREDDIAIDAPRYMDTLGQVLGQSLVPLNTARNRSLMRTLTRQFVFAYGKKSGHKLLASILRALASAKNEAFATQIFIYSNLSFSSKIWNEEFLETQEIQFVNKRSSPEPREVKKAQTNVDKLADEVTDLIQHDCAPQKIEDLVQGLGVESGDKTEYLSTVIYAIVRACLDNTSGEYKLNEEALNKYSSLLKNEQCKKEQQDAITLRVLTALTKLWHEYNCPEDLMRSIVSKLHDMGSASQGVLMTWLNSEDLKDIPSIDAARLSSRQFIEGLATTST